MICAGSEFQVYFRFYIALCLLFLRHHTLIRDPKSTALYPWYKLL